jgi:hypothetical protein
MSHTMWIETVIEDGKEIQQLQYEQVMAFVFAFGTDGGTYPGQHAPEDTEGLVMCFFPIDGLLDWRSIHMSHLGTMVAALHL